MEWPKHNKQLKGGKPPFLLDIGFGPFHIFPAFGQSMYFQLLANHVFPALAFHVFPAIWGAIWGAIWAAIWAAIWGAIISQVNFVRTCNIIITNIISQGA